MHQIADLPHQCLMAIDDRLCGSSVVVEARRRHRPLDLADGALAVGDLGFELIDSCAMGEDST